MRSWRVVSIVAACENGRPNLPLRLLLRAYFFGPPSKTPLLLSIPSRIPHDRARNLNRLGTPIQAHNYNKVNGDTEAGQQKDADAR